jgi:hypothetical protein
MVRPRTKARTVAAMVLCRIPQEWVRSHFQPSSAEDEPLGPDDELVSAAEAEALASADGDAL